MKVSIYIREKNNTGCWRYSRVNTGRGRRPADLRGPFYLRYTNSEGKQPFVRGGDTLEAATDAAERLQTGLLAQSKGLTVSELDDMSNANRVPIRVAVLDFLEQKKNKAKRTVEAYTLHLNEFLQSLQGGVRFMDEITAHTLRAYKDSMEKKGFAGKTIHNRLLTILFLLKKNGIKNPLAWDEMPTIEDEPAVAYTEDELKILFAHINPEEAIRYKFFLGTGCRDREVTFAAWQDIDFAKATYHIRRKEDVGFTPKSHESRTVPLPGSLVTMLKERRKNVPNPRWIFVNEEGRPESHFLRKLKTIALRAGLNCGQCSTTVTKGKYDRKFKAKVSCATVASMPALVLASSSQNVRDALAGE